MNLLMSLLLLFNLLLFQQENIEPKKIVEEVIKLYKAGTSQDIIKSYIKNYREKYLIDATDILFLKESGVPEEIIKELIANQALFPPEKEKESFKEFKSLILKRGFFAKNRLGDLVVKGDRIEWYDEKKPSLNFSFKIDNIKAVNLKCKPKTIQESFCYEIVFENFRGKNYTFSDFNWETGENKNILALYDYLKANYKNIIYGTYF